MTIALKGEVEHRDNKGGGGVIGSGDVQWMTAGRQVACSLSFRSHLFNISLLPPALCYAICCLWSLPIVSRLLI